MTKKKYWAVSVYQEDNRIARFTFDNFDDAIERIMAICLKDEAIDKVEIENWLESM